MRSLLPQPLRAKGYDPSSYCTPNQARSDAAVAAWHTFQGVGLGPVACLINHRGGVSSISRATPRA